MRRSRNVRRNMRVGDPIILPESANHWPSLSLEKLRERSESEIDDKIKELGITTNRRWDYQAKTLAIFNYYAKRKRT